MHTKSKYQSLRHLDFMVIDLISMLLAFTLAYFIKFESFDFVKSSEWLGLVLLISVLDIVIGLLAAPYNGIFKRKYYMEIVRAVQLTGFNMISVTLLLYIFKQGATYSRAVFIMMYSFYFVISLLLKYIWKKLILSGKISLSYSKNITLFIIADRENIESTLTNVSAGDYDPTI